MPTYYNYDGDGYGERAEIRRNWNWLPLLIVPLLILGALFLWPYVASNVNKGNNGQNLFDSNTTQDTNRDAQVGIGGAPADVTGTPSVFPTASVSPSISPTEKADDTTMDARPKVGIGAGPDDATTPDAAPNTGFGR